MVKIEQYYIGNIHLESIYSITEIDCSEETVILPTQRERGTTVTRIGYEGEKREETRSEYEIWKDQYYYNYYPEVSEYAREVIVSPNVKKIVIPSTIKRISKSAFKNVKDIEFEIDKDNQYYKVEDGKIIEISTNEVIWPDSQK